MKLYHTWRWFAGFLQPEIHAQLVEGRRLPGAPTELTEPQSSVIGQHSNNNNNSIRKQCKT
jgi:phage replication-related protein YjqB (UPF0714/DUF867 family)